MRVRRGGGLAFSVIKENPFRLGQHWLNTLYYNEDAFSNLSEQFGNFIQSYIKLSMHT